MKGKYFQLAKEKKVKSFKEAFQKQFGFDWPWKKEDGTLNHPMDSEDDQVKFFYLGYRSVYAASKTVEDIAKEMDKLEAAYKKIEKLVRDL